MSIPITEVKRLSRLYEGEALVLDATDGIDTLWVASDVFTGHRDPDLKAWGLDVSGKPTPKCPVAVYEQIVDGTYAQTVLSLGTPLNKLCLQQSQIKLFCRSFSNKLRTGGYSTRFLFTKGGEEANEDGSNVFVAGVRFDGPRSLKADVYRFSDDDVWYGERRVRFVFPQLES